MSGAILTMMGRRGEPVATSRARAAMTRERSSSRAAGACRSRSPGVFGDEMLIVEIARDTVEGVDARHVVARTIDAILIGADVHSDDAGSTFSRFETRQRRRVPAIVEAEPVDQTAIGGRAGRRAASGCPAAASASRCRLRQSRSPSEHGIGHARIFVEACGDPDRVWKIETENRLAQNGIVGGKRAWMEAQFERFQCSLVRVFGFQREERRTRQPVKTLQHVNHASSRA